jgi:hypothetical protein
MAGQLAAYGYTLLPDERRGEAALWLLNSCTVKNPSQVLRPAVRARACVGGLRAACVRRAVLGGACAQERLPPPPSPRAPRAPRPQHDPPLAHTPPPTHTPTQPHTVCAGEPHCCGQGRGQGAAHRGMRAAGGALAARAQ